ncbi:MAG: hypothetical protein M3P51_12770 [Chloroflexota bacterium]|nr:hypothetical protein [Chloroflexota bacterium]
MRTRGLLFFLALLLALQGAGVAAGPDSTTVRLDAQNKSGINGTATLTDNGNGTTTISIKLRNTKANSMHPGHLHEGTCKGTIPTIRYPLEDVVDGKSETTVKAPLGRLLSEELYINLHPSHEKLFPVITCGGLNAPDSLPRTGAGGALLPAAVLAPVALLGMLSLGFAMLSLRIRRG